MVNNQEKKLEDTGGKKIGFLLQYPFHYFVFKNIYQELLLSGQDVEFIIDPTGFYPVKPEEKTIVSIKQLLTKEGVSFSEFNFKDFFFKEKINNFLASYDTLVSTWHRGIIKDAFSHKRIFVTYGAGKELTTFGFWKRYFDLCLAYGEYDNAFFSQVSESVIVGNPKFDDWFLKKNDTKLANIVNVWCDKNKKTLLYLPTHSNLCSIKDLAMELKKIAKEYNVIVKLHYYIPQDQPELVDMLRCKDILLFEDDVDLITLLSFSDVVLSDNSSAIFDAMLADKPVVVTDFLHKDYFVNEYLEIKNRIYRRGVTGVLTYSNSIEQRIKKDGTVISIKKPEELRSAIAGAFIDKEIVKRGECRKKLFAYTDGKSAKRASDAIIAFKNKKDVAEKPFLAHAIDNFERELMQSSFYHSDNGKQENNKKNNVFIISHKSNSDQDVGVTVDSLKALSDSSTVFVVGKKSASFGAQKNIIFFDNYKSLFTEIVGKYDSYIFLSSGVCFSRSKEDIDTFFVDVQEKISRLESDLVCGHVDSLKETVDSDVLKLSRYYNFSIQSVNLPNNILSSAKSVIWNNGVNDCRFFIVSNFGIEKLLTSNLTDWNSPQALFLAFKFILFSLRRPTEIVPIFLKDFSDRRDFLKRKEFAFVYFESEHLQTLSYFRSRFFLTILYGLYSKKTRIRSVLYFFYLSVFLVVSLYFVRLRFFLNKRAFFA